MFLTAERSERWGLGSDVSAVSVQSELQGEGARAPPAGHAGLIHSDQENSVLIISESGGGLPM